MDESTEKEPEIVVPGMAAFPSMAGLVLLVVDIMLFGWFLWGYLSDPQTPFLGAKFPLSVLFLNGFVCMILFILLRSSCWIFRRNEVIYHITSGITGKTHYDITGYRMELRRYSVMFVPLGNGIIHRGSVRRFWIGNKYHDRLRLFYENTSTTFEIETGQADDVDDGFR